MISHAYFSLSSIFREWTLSMRGELVFAILRSKIYPSFDINHQLISEFINLSFGIFRYLPFFENGRSLPLGELLLEILWSKIYPWFDMNNDHAYFSLSSIFREWTFAVYERSLRSKIYSSFDINDRPCLFPNLPRYLLIYSLFREWTLVVYERRVSFRDTTIKNLSIIRYKWSDMLISEFAKISMFDLSRMDARCLWDESTDQKFIHHSI